MKKAKIDKMNDIKDLDVIEREDEYPDTDDLVELNVKGIIDDEDSTFFEDEETPEYIASKTEIEMQIEILKDMCIKAKKPMFVSVAINPKVTNEDGSVDTEYVTNALIPYTIGVKLQKDLISPMLLVMQGFNVRSDIPMDFDLREDEKTAMADVEEIKAVKIEKKVQDDLKENTEKSLEFEEESFVDDSVFDGFGFESVNL